MKRKFKLGDHVSYENKRHKYSLTGTIICVDYGGYYLIETDSLTGQWSYMGTKEINIYSEFIPDHFHGVSTWGTRRSISDKCVWKHARGLRHSMTEYVYDQSGDTDEDI